ncbi:MAG: photosynthetic complex putative assembly protein PuhB [Pseudomonadota bacterium]
MSDHDDFAFEPIPGLPERLPEGEEILWQGRPDWWALTRSALWFWPIAAWFAALVLWRFVAVSDQMPLTAALWSVLPLVIMWAVVAMLLIATAYAQAKASLYTVTNKRVVMRVGAALSVTFNLPYKQLANAEMEVRRDGTGTIALALKGKNRVSYLVAWPHVRPWYFRTQPALRCIAEPKAVAALIAEHAAARMSEPQITRVTPDAVPAE